MHTTQQHRKVRYICFGNHPDNGQLYDEQIPALSSDQARRLFHDRFGFFPARVTAGPSSYYERKIIKLTANAVRYTGKRWRGIYQGWWVYAVGVQACEADGVAYKANELVDLWPDRPVKAHTRKPKLGRLDMVRLGDLVQLNELD